MLNLVLALGILFCYYVAAPSSLRFLASIDFLFYKLANLSPTPFYRFLLIEDTSVAATYLDDLLDLDE